MISNTTHSSSLIFQGMINTYKESINALVFEKNGLSNQEIERKTEKCLSLVKSLLLSTEQEEINNNPKLIEKKRILIIGDKDFQERTNDDLEKICKLKPGRKLFKALIKIEKLTLVIRPSEVSEQIFDSYNEEKFSAVMIQNKDYSDYYTYADQGKKLIRLRPRFVLLAHELVHSLHASSDFSLMTKSYLVDMRKYFFGIGNFILEDMDNLEEQHTIIGFNHLIFSKKDSLDKLDVLCESAFLMALKLPPRVDHRGFEEDRFPLMTNEERSLDQYYEWLERKLANLDINPENLANSDKKIQ